MSKAAIPGSRRGGFLILIATPLLAIVALFAWGLSSPVGSSPDDDFHLASIWCGHGESAGCEEVAEGERSVYEDLVIDSVCYAYDTTASAGCQGDDFGDNPQDVRTTERGNFSGLYPPLYYFTMSLFAGPDIETSVLLMKVANSLLFVGLASALFWLLPIHRRPVLLWSMALSVVPLGMFLIPSTNPSGWAILSAGTLWLALLGVFESTGKRRIGLAAIATLATLIGAGARADAAIYAGFAIVLVLFLTYRKSREYFYGAIFAVVLLVLAITLYFSASQGNAVSGGLAPVDPDDRVNPLVLTLANLINVPALWVGVFGSWNLGWLDTAVPASVWVASFGVFCGAVFLGLGARVPRKGIVLIAIVAALFVVPTVLLVQSNSLVGANVQPRYLLPLIVILAGFVILYDPERPVRATAVHRWLVVVALSLANAVALQANVRRYVTGSDVFSVDLDSGAEWWWDLPVSPMVVWIVGSLAFAGLLICINLLTVRTARVVPALV